MSIRYRNRERRLARTISRIETARRVIAEHRDTAAAHEAWWRRHGRTLHAWRKTIAETQRRQPAERPAIAADRFRRWTYALRWHPFVLRMRLECWWLAVKVGVRGLVRGPRA